MKLQKLPYDLSICKVEDVHAINFDAEVYFLGKTDEEVSLVCKSADVPAKTLKRDDGWRGFRVDGVLDFALIGILSKLSAILAQNDIGIFAISTFNTDYILVKSGNFDKACHVLSANGYTVY